MSEPELPPSPEPVLGAEHDHLHDDHAHPHEHVHSEEEGVLATKGKCGRECAKCLACKKPTEKTGE